MYKSSSSRPFGLSIFRKPAVGFRRILLLLTVPAVILLIRYRIQDLASVRDQTPWQSRTGELQAEESQNKNLISVGTVCTKSFIFTPKLTDHFPDNMSPYKVSLSSLNGAASADSSQSEPHVEISNTYQSDDIFNGGLQRSIISHENAEDVSIVAAKSGPESTDWIEEFCED